MRWRLNLERTAVRLGSLLALAVGGCLQTGWTQGMVLHLRNGDRLTGTVLLEETNQITFKTTWLNVVVVPMSEVQSRAPAPAGPPEAAAVPTTPASRPGAPGAGPGRLAQPTEPTVALTAPPPVPAEKAKHWAGEAQVGMDLLFSQKNRQLYTTRAKVTYGRDRFRSIFDHQFTYGRTDGVLSDNRMYGTLKTDWDLDRRFYLYNLAGGGYDEIRRIDLRYEVGPGLGYHLLKRDNLVLRTEWGVNYQAQFQANDENIESFFLRLAEDFTWRISSRLSLDERLEFFPRLGEWSHYRIRFETNLRYALLNNLFLVVTLLDQYDSRPARGIPQNDLHFRSSIALKF